MEIKRTLFNKKDAEIASECEGEYQLSFITVNSTELIPLSQVIILWRLNPLLFSVEELN